MKPSVKNRRSPQAFPIQIERHGPREVGAIGSDMRVSVSSHHLGPGVTERVVESYRHDGVARLHGSEELRRARGGAAVMAYLQEVGSRVFVQQELFNSLMRVPDE